MFECTPSGGRQLLVLLVTKVLGPVSGFRVQGLQGPRSLRVFGLGLQVLLAWQDSGGLRFGIVCPPNPAPQPCTCAPQLTDERATAPAALTEPLDLQLISDFFSPKSLTLNASEEDPASTEPWRKPCNSPKSDFPKSNVWNHVQS